MTLPTTSCRATSGGHGIAVEDAGEGGSASPHVIESRGEVRAPRDLLSLDVRGVEDAATKDKRQRGGRW